MSTVVGAPVRRTRCVIEGRVERIDLKELKACYSASARNVTELVVPEFNFLMVDGKGDPNTSAEYAQAVEALFVASYAVKFALRRELARDYVVMPLEGLWWADDLASFARGDREQWQWTMMIMQPPEATEAMVREVIHRVRDRKPLPVLDRLRFAPFAEGRSAQILHVGPFSTEGPTIERLHEYAASRSALRGKHHEIYLSDVRRAAPERWRTIIRQPMA